MDQKWFKYTFVCNSECDALIEYTFKPGYTPNNVTDVTCLCGSYTTPVSVEDATILPITEKKEETMSTATTTYMEEQVNELKAQLANHQNCDYWKSENGRIQRQLIELVTDAYENDSDSADILRGVCEIIDFEPKGEVSFTATITVTGRMDVPLGEDVASMLEDIEFSVEAYNGDVIIDDYSTNEIEER